MIDKGERCNFDFSCCDCALASHEVKQKDFVVDDSVSRLKT
jgi:hypothetical protein